jgi:hypothetical protein
LSVDRLVRGNSQLGAVKEDSLFGRSENFTICESIAVSACEYRAQIRIMKAKSIQVRKINTTCFSNHFVVLHYCSQSPGIQTLDWDPNEL